MGNRKFRILIAMNLQQYTDADNRSDLCLLTESIVNQIREASPRGGFVKQDSKGEWYEIGNRMARKKVAHTFRDFAKGKSRRSYVCSFAEKKKDLMERQNSILRGCQIAYTN